MLKEIIELLPTATLLRSKRTKEPQYERIIGKRPPANTPSLRRGFPGWATQWTLTLKNDTLRLLLLDAGHLVTDTLSLLLEGLPGPKSTVPVHHFVASDILKRFAEVCCLAQNL